MRLKAVFIFLLFTQLSLFSQEFKSPSDYLTFVNNDQIIISKSNWKYTQALAHTKNANRQDVTKKQLINAIKTAKSKLELLKDGYKGDVEYRDQIIQYYDVSIKNLSEEYDKIIDMQKVAEQSYDAMEAYLMKRDLINERMNSENEKAHNAFNAFAKKYNITVKEGEESELSKKIKHSNEVFNYHTNLYLIFFKANYTDSNLSNAIKSDDLGAIQQNAKTLLQYAEEGLSKLNTIVPFEGDNSMIVATRNVLEYYKKEALDYVPKLVTFLMFNDKFENAKKSLETKSQADRTQEEVDKYNEMVKQVNKEINTYNKDSDTNFQEKNTAINTWDTAGDRFISSHVPEN